MARRQKAQPEGYVNVLRLAKEAGLNPIECPYCHHKVKTGGAIAGMFRAILKEVRKGYFVYVPNFGAFFQRIWPGRKMNTPRFPDLKWVGPRKTVGWRAGKGVSEFMNGAAKRIRRVNEAAKEMSNEA